MKPTYLWIWIFLEIFALQQVVHSANANYLLNNIKMLQWTGAKKYIFAKIQKLQKIGTSIGLFEDALTKFKLHLTSFQINAHIWEKQGDVTLNLTRAQNILGILDPKTEENVLFGFLYLFSGELREIYNTRKCYDIYIKVAHTWANH